MKGIQVSHARQTVITISLLLASICGGVVCAQAQYLVQADGENVQQRIARARALAAVGNLPAARSELESLARVQTDESVREIALVLLVGVYLDQSDYTYAEGLLNDTFAARQAKKDEATHAYFALAGQTINGVRAHLERYRALGLDVSDGALPSEATGDLDHLRALVERVVNQGKQLVGEPGRTTDASALIEEAAGVRARLARNAAERAQWQREVADARQRLASGTGARLTVAPARATQTETPAPTPAPTPAATPAPTPVATPVVTPSGANTAGVAPTPAPDADGASAQPLEVGAQLVTKAKEKFAPSYPAQARTARVTGNVMVFLTVDERGEVAEVVRTSGPEMLRQAAADAARRWKFRPTLVNGQPVRVSGYISFQFTL